MDFQLHNGKRLAEATREDVLEDAAWWRKEARRMFRDAEVLKQFLKDSK
jgi:hypothetical protein